MSSENPQRQSFLGELLTKLAYVIGVGREAHINTDSLVKEVQRQIRQTSIKKGGNPITGEGVTKSGPED